MTHHSVIQNLLADAWRKRGQNDYDEARKLVEQAQEMCEENDYPSLGRIHHVFMQFESDHHDYSKALKFSRMSVNYYQMSGDNDRVGHSIRHMATLESHNGLIFDAERHFLEAIDLYKANTVTSPGNLANALREYAILLEKLDKKEDAVAVWKETRDLYFLCHLQEGVDEAESKIASLI